MNVEFQAGLDSSSLRHIESLMHDSKYTYNERIDALSAVLTGILLTEDERHMIKRYINEFTKREWAAIQQKALSMSELNKIHSKLESSLARLNETFEKNKARYKKYEQERIIENLVQNVYQITPSFALERVISTAISASISSLLPQDIRPLEEIIFSNASLLRYSERKLVKSYINYLQEISLERESNEKEISFNRDSAAQSYQRMRSYLDNPSQTIQRQKEPEKTPGLIKRLFSLFSVRKPAEGKGF